MYKKLILTFTLAAGLSVLPNAFAAPSTKPGPAPKPNTTKTTTQFEDSIDVLADFKKGRRPPPRRHGEDSINVLAWKQPPQRPGGPRPKGRHGEDSINVLAADIPPAAEPKWKKRPKGRHSEDSTIV